MIAYRFDVTHRAEYVSDLPGHGGADWGYTLDANRALNLSRMWNAGRRTF